MNKAIWWIRRDLRLKDNQALALAMSAARQVSPVFVIDPRLVNSTYSSGKRLAFLFEGLRSLDASMKTRGSYLIVRRGDPAGQLATLLTETGADQIFAEEDYSPFAVQRDSRIKTSLPITFTQGLTVHHPLDVVKSDGSPYTVFTPFSRSWLNLPAPKTTDILPAPEHIRTPPGIASESLPESPRLVEGSLFPASSLEAERRLIAFLDDSISGIYAYKETRNRPDLDGTSGLSPYFRFGLISARQAAVTAFSAIQEAPDAAAAASAQTWLNELIWREFYQSILYHYPFVRTHSFRQEFRQIRWQNDPDDFHAWCEGKTGYPIVDAAMRQLRTTGWMHNRSRMIVASFLTKDLLIDWQWGETWFMQHLVDGDPAANNGGWQWTAGVGTDAAPYFRIYNPILQSQKFDPNGSYIRQYVPELKSVPDEFIHEPWKMPIAIQHKTGCLIGTHYPSPIIDHNWARARTLSAYSLSKQSPISSRDL